METREREDLLVKLRIGRSELLAVLADVNDEFAARIPSPGSWSILNCVEHLAISEEYLFSQIGSSQSSDAPPLNRLREAVIVARGMDRTKTVQSPEVGLPIGRFATLSEALQYFLKVRERTIQFVEQCTDDLRCKRTSHPLIGEVNCQEVLLMISVHPRRHVKQIEEIKLQIS